MTTDDDLIGSVEAAAILDKSPRTVHRMAESGVLPYIKIPGGYAGIYLYKRADVKRVKAERDAAAA